MGVASLNKGLSRSDWGLRWEGPSGPHRSVSEVSGRKQSSAGAGGVKRSRMPRRGCHRQVTGGGQTGFLTEILNVSVTDSSHK